MSAKSRATFAKAQRERAVKEKRELKQARKRARKEEKLRAAETSETSPDTGETDVSAEAPSGV